MARVVSMKSAKTTATPRGRSAGAPTAAKLGWNDHERAGEAHGAGGDAAGADLLVEEEPAEQQHDEGHHEGDGDRVGEGQVLEREEHAAEADDVEQRPERRQPGHPAGHGETPPARRHEREEQEPLEGEPRGDEDKERDARAEKLRHPVAERREDAETQHQENAEDRTVGGHGCDLCPAAAARASR